VREQLEVLEHHADAAAQLGQVGLRVADADAVDHDVALLEGLQRVDGLDQRGLARARRAADHHHLALLMLVVQSVSTWKLPYHLETFLISASWRLLNG
jgi:hypothetical protein